MSVGTVMRAKEDCATRKMCNWGGYVNIPRSIINQLRHCVPEVDEDAEDELDKPGTTMGTKSSKLQIVRIPSLMRCGF